MAKYDVTMSCGHTKTIELFGKMDERYKKIEWLEKYGLCDECNKALQTERAIANGLPALTGTEKQVNWALSIRERILTEVDAVSEKYKINSKTHEEWLKAEVQGKAIKKVLGKFTEARFWIDNRDRSVKTIIALNKLSDEIRTEFANLFIIAANEDTLAVDESDAVTAKVVTSDVEDDGSNDDPDEESVLDTVGFNFDDDEEDDDDELIDEPEIENAAAVVNEVPEVEENTGAKFEVGKVYVLHDICYTVTKRTEKFVTFKHQTAQSAVLDYYKEVVTRKAIKFDDEGNEVVYGLSAFGRLESTVDLEKYEKLFNCKLTPEGKFVSYNWDAENTINVEFEDVVVESEVDADIEGETAEENTVEEMAAVVEEVQEVVMVDYEDDGSNDDPDEESILDELGIGDEEELIDKYTIWKDKVTSYTYHALMVDRKGNLTFDGKRISRDNADLEIKRATGRYWRKNYKDIHAILLVDEGAIKYILRAQTTYYLPSKSTGNLKFVDFGRDEIPYINQKVLDIVAWYQDSAQAEDEKKAAEIARKNSLEYQRDCWDVQIREIEYSIRVQKQLLVESSKRIRACLGAIAEYENEIWEIGIFLDELKKDLAFRQAVRKAVADQIATRNAFNAINAAAADMADDGSNDDEEEETVLDELPAYDENEDDDELIDEPEIDTMAEVVDEVPQVEFALERFTDCDIVAEINSIQTAIRDTLKKLDELRERRRQLLELEFGTDYCKSRPCSGSKPLFEYVDAILTPLVFEQNCSTKFIGQDGKIWDMAKTGYVTIIEPRSAKPLTVDKLKEDDTHYCYVMRGFSIPSATYCEYSTLKQFRAVIQELAAAIKRGEKQFRFPADNMAINSAIDETPQIEVNTMSAAKLDAIHTQLFGATDAETQAAAIRAQIDSQKYSAQKLLDAVDSVDNTLAVDTITFELRQFTDEGEEIVEVEEKFLAKDSTEDTDLTPADTFNQLVDTVDNDAEIDTKMKNKADRAMELQTDIETLSNEIERLESLLFEKKDELDYILHHELDVVNDALTEYLNANLVLKGKSIKITTITTSVVHKMELDETCDVWSQYTIYGKVGIFVCKGRTSCCICLYEDIKSFKKAVRELSAAVERGDVEYTCYSD